MNCRNDDGVEQITKYSSYFSYWLAELVFYIDSFLDLLTYWNIVTMLTHRILDVTSQMAAMVTYQWHIHLFGEQLCDNRALVGTTLENVKKCKKEIEH